MINPVGDGNVLYLDCILVTIVLQDATIEENWVKGKWAVSELFPIIEYKSKIISK